MQTNTHFGEILNYILLLLYWVSSPFYQVFQIIFTQYLLPHTFETLGERAFNMSILISPDTIQILFPSMLFECVSNLQVHLIEIDKCNKQKD